MNSLIYRASILLAAIVTISGCGSMDERSSDAGDLAPISSIAPSVTSEGTLANEVLIQDATIALESVLSREILATGVSVIKFVIQQPAGTPESRAWREMWVVDPEGNSRSFIITFSEAGLGAADFQIQDM